MTKIILDNFRAPAPGLDGTVNAQARVYDTAAVFNPAALMQVVLGEDGMPTDQETDFFGGGAPSAFAVVPDGPGLCAMAFKKTAGGADSYVGEAYCVTGGGAGAVIGLTKRINQ